MRGRHRKNQANADDWLILSDLSMGGFIIFLIIAVVYMTRYSSAMASPENSTISSLPQAQRIIDSLDRINKKMQDSMDIYRISKLGIYDVLKDFDNMPMIDVQTDGTIRFRVENGYELFRSGKAERTLEFQNVITKFLPVYFKKIRPYFEAGQLVEIRIEGHTDINCENVNQGELECYKYNLSLSAARARNVHDVMFQHQQFHKIKDKEILRGMIISTGYSYSKTLDVNGHLTSESGLPPDDANSRRVDLKTLIRPKQE